MKTTGNKTNTRMAGLLAVLVAAGVMGGCATPRGMIESLEARMEKHGIQEITLLGSSNVGSSFGTPEGLCVGHENDPRCRPGEIEQYRTGFARVRDFGFTGIDVPFLVKSAELPREFRADIFKVRIKKGEIPWFEGRITKGVGEPDCYNDGGFGRGSAGRGGVVCPRLDYDYRKIPMLN